MTNKQEVKRNILRKIMELRTKDMIEEDCILDVLDDNLDPYVAELETQIDEMKNCFNCAKGTFENRNCCVRCGCVNRDKWEMKKNNRAEKFIIKE